GLLRPAAGGRPALLPASAAQPLRRRGARDRPRLAVRRRLERRARAPPPARRPPPLVQRDRARPGAGHRSRGRAAPTRLPPALRPARGGVRASLARATLRADRLRARLRPRSPR